MEDHCLTEAELAELARRHRNNELTSADTEVFERHFFMCFSCGSRLIEIEKQIQKTEIAKKWNTPTSPLKH